MANPFTLALLICVGPLGGQAWAQKIESLVIYQNDNSETIASSASSSEYKKDKYFNLARCKCSEPGDTTDMKIRLKFNNWSQIDDTLVAVMVGSGSCLKTDNSKSILDTDRCTMILGEANKFKKIRELSAEFDILTKSVQLMGGDCAKAGNSDQMNIYVFTDETKTKESWLNQATIAYTVDSEPPGKPKLIETLSGENLVDIKFDAPSYSSSAADGGAAVTDPTILGYQVLCQVVEGGEVVFTSPPKPEYESTINLCGHASITSPVDGGSVDASSSSGLTPYAAGDASTEGSFSEAGISEAGISEAGLTEAGLTEAGPIDAAPIDAGPQDAAVVDAAPKDAAAVETNNLLDDKFVCSELSSSPGTIRVSGLSNEVKYQFYLVTIDKLLNPSEPLDAGMATPMPAEDLWERYKRSGGTAQGGYCAVSGESPTCPVGLVLVLGLGLFFRRIRSRRPRAGGSR